MNRSALRQLPICLTIFYCVKAQGGVCHQPEAPLTANTCNNSEMTSAVVDARANCERFLFSFEPKFDCNKVEADALAPNAKSECMNAVQKNWTAEERSIIEGAMRLLVSNPKLTRFFPALSVKGPTKIFRATKLVSADITPGARPYAYISAVHDGLVITDSVFEDARRWLQECEGFLFEDPQKEIARILLHELAHRYADMQDGLDQDCSWLKVTGWDGVSNSLKEINPEKVRELRLQGIQLLANGKSTEAAAWTKSKARKFGFPNLYAMTSATEGFAEILTFYALDAEVETYLKPAVLKWYDENLVRAPKKAKQCPIRAM